MRVGFTIGRNRAASVFMVLFVGFILTVDTAQGETVKERLRRARMEEESAGRLLNASGEGRSLMPVVTPPVPTGSKAPAPPVGSRLQSFQPYDRRGADDMRPMEETDKEEALELYSNYMDALRTRDLVGLIRSSSPRLRHFLQTSTEASPVSSLLEEFGLAGIDEEPDGDIVNTLTYRDGNEAWLYLEKGNSGRRIQGFVRLIKENNEWKVDAIRWQPPAVR